MLDLALQQPDAPVLLRGYTANAANFLYEAVKIQNASDETVTAISFGVIVADPAQPQEGWSMVRTWPVPVALPAGASQHLQINLLPPSQLKELVRTFTRSPKITLGVLDVQWEDGSKWQFDVPSGSLDFSAGHVSLGTVASVQDTGGRPAALASQDCLHGPTETADQKGRRQAALTALRVINSVQAMEKNAKGRYVGQTELATSTFARDGSAASGLALDRASIVPGFEAKVVATADAYSVVLRDVQDPCAFAYASDEKGVIYTAQPIR